MKKYITELIGSFFLVLALGMTGNALASGLMIIPIIYMGAHISGAHYNPAISISFWATGNMPQKTMWGYIGIQTAGAIAGCLMIYFMAGSAYQTVPSSAVTPLQYGSAELIFVLLLCMLYLTLFLTEQFKGNRIYGVAIGLSYAGILLIGEPVSGGAFNPSVAIAASLVDFFDYGESYMYLPVFVLAPAVGGIFAGHLFNYLLKQGPGSQEAK
jgi:aquaporin Z